MTATDTIIAHTRKWILDVVIGCNFCPFAAKEIKNNTVQYKVVPKDSRLILTALAESFLQMHQDEKVETILLILPQGFPTFDGYLDILQLGEELLLKEKMTGIYQLASFHPLYRFEGSLEDDAANYTNRSPYPIIQILRESSITSVLEKFHGDIPKRNITYAEKLGLLHMQVLLNSCII